MFGRTILALVALGALLGGCSSRRGGTVGPEPQPVEPGFLVFASDRDESHGEIYIMREDGAHVTRLTFNAVEDAAPLLSPDGSRITFRRELNPASVFVMKVDGSGQVGLAPGKRAEWSPDGSKLALVAESLAVMNADATGRHLFSVGAFYVTWSPDGSKLAYVSTGLGGQAVNDIYTISPTGTGALRITTDGVAKNSLSWSPDGAKLAYGASDRIYVINADGSGPASPSPGRGARWSPDGTRLLFVTDEYDANEEIYSVRLDGSDALNLSQNSARDSDPDWGPRQ